MDPLLFLTFAVAFAASVMSSIAGGGGGLIISPYLLLIGLPPQIAVATPKLAGLGLAFRSLQKFRKAKLIDRRWIYRLLPLSLFGGLAGPYILIRTPEQTVTWLVVILSIVLSFATFRSKAGLRTTQPSAGKKAWGIYPTESSLSHSRRTARA